MAGSEIVPSGVTRTGLALAADARPAIDRRAQVVQLRVDLQRRDGDGRDLVVLLIQLFQRVGATARPCGPSAWTWPRRRKRDRAVGLHDQVAVQVRIGERLDADLVAHVQPVRLGVSSRVSR